MAAVRKNSGGRLAVMSEETYDELIGNSRLMTI